MEGNGPQSDNGDRSEGEEKSLLEGRMKVDADNSDQDHGNGGERVEELSDIVADVIIVLAPIYRSNEDDARQIVSNRSTPITE